jgi:hypothetical protein
MTGDAALKIKNLDDGKIKNLITTNKSKIKLLT